MSSARVDRDSTAVCPMLTPKTPASVSILSGLLRRPTKYDYNKNGGGGGGVFVAPIDLSVTVLRADEDDEDEWPRRAFTKEGTHLGVHAGDVPRLLREFREYHFELRRRRRRDGNDDVDSMLDATACHLLLCPDQSTAWADRRRVLLLSGVSNSDVSNRHLENELAFLDLLFTQHSKASTSWAHRRWVLHRLLDRDDDVVAAERRLRREVAICVVVAEAFPKNYYAWTHRAHCRRAALDRLPEDAAARFLEDESATVIPWLRAHPSDHSCAHHGAKTLSSLSSSLTALARESAAARALCEGSPVHAVHEAVWSYRRFCAHLTVERTRVAAERDGDLEVSLRSAAATLDELRNACALETGDAPSEDERARIRVHARSYVAWVWFSVRRSWGRSKVEHLRRAAVEVETTAREALTKLREEKLVVHNYWRKDRAGT